MSHPPSWQLEEISDFEMSILIVFLLILFVLVMMGLIGGIHSFVLWFF